MSDDDDWLVHDSEDEYAGWEPRRAHLSSQSSELDSEELTSDDQAESGAETADEAEVKRKSRKKLKQKRTREARLYERRQKVRAFQSQILLI